MKTLEQIQRRANKLLKQFNHLHPQYEYYNQFRHDKRARKIKKELVSIAQEYKVLHWVLKSTPKLKTKNICN